MSIAEKAMAVILGLTVLVTGGLAAVAVFLKEKD